MSIHELDTDIRHPDLEQDLDTLRRDFHTLRTDLREDFGALREDLRTLRRDGRLELQQRIEGVPVSGILLAVTAGLGLGLAVWGRLRSRAHS